MFLIIIIIKKKGFKNVLCSCQHPCLWMALLFGKSQYLEWIQFLVLKS